MTARLKISAYTKRHPNSVELRLFVLVESGFWHRVGTLSLTGVQYMLLFKPLILAGAKSIGASVEIDEESAPSVRTRG